MTTATALTPTIPPLASSQALLERVAAPAAPAPAPEAADAFAPAPSAGAPVADSVKGVLKGVARGISATSGVVVGAAYPSYLFHELGHAAVVKALYLGTTPTVEVHPFGGGMTRYSTAHLSNLGQAIGADGSRALVAAAGSVVDAASVGLSFAAGYRMRKKHPIAGALLMGYAASVNLNSIYYAASAVGKSLPLLASRGHDFATLATTAGIPPIVSVAVMASIIPIEYAILRWAEKHGH